MQITGSERRQKPLTILMVLGVLVGVFCCVNMAGAGVYDDSAHGNTGYGVNRIGAAYDTGDCMNCHDLFDLSICDVNPVHLFALLDYDSQWDSFCISCHKGPSTSAQETMPNQYTYSVTRGGAPTGCPANVRGAFRFVNELGQQRDQCGSTEGSSHFLGNVRSALAGKSAEWGFDSDPDNVNGCHACHNPHVAKQDFPCSLASDHASGSPWEVWGDEAGEKMSDYATGGYYLNYYPPYKYPFPVGTEPPELYLGLPPPQPSEWDPDYWAPDAPDYVTLCQECHQDPQYSTRLSRNLLAINWENGDRHGKKGEPGAAACYYGFRKYPYGSDCFATSTEYKVVMCTDCHDPHGSPNEFLLRTCVNGQDGLTVPGPGEWWNFCQACHFLTYNPGYHSSSLNCPNCHGHGNNTPFGEGF